MSVDIEIWIGDEQFPFSFNGEDTRTILQGIDDWSGFATDKFLVNFRAWHTQMALVTIRDHWGPWFTTVDEWARRLYAMAEVNRTYVRWSKS